MDLEPGLMLVHGNRAEQLRDVLVTWLRHYPLDPLEQECVLVHSNGIAQWLRLAMADRESGCGIAAALDFLLPARFLWRAYRAVLGPDTVPRESPLDKEALVWRLMRLLPALSQASGDEVLRRFLRDDGTGRKRYQLARRLADQFDQYQVYRADWLRGWARGDTTLTDARGRPHPLPEEQAWQARLWRTVLDDLGRDGRPVGRAAIHEAFMDAVADPRRGAAPPGLPRRIVVFGISTMPHQALEALAGLARWAQILVCVNNPCAHYWADIVADHDMLRARFRRQSRRPGMADSLDAESLHQQTHPLLASWGRQGRDFIGLLDDFDDPDLRASSGRALAALHQRIDVFEALPGDTVLQQLQDDVRDLRPLTETRARWPAVNVSADRSLCFHVAHSPQRELEILHDQLLAAFDADPTLRPRDVIVMVPDIEAYAPGVQAVFGQYDGHDPRHIPYAVADRPQRHSDPLVIVLERLLALPEARLGLQDVLEWLDVPALRARFDMAAADVPALQRWARESNVRWGLHADHKTSFDLTLSAEAAHAHSWHFGLQRMVLGYAAGFDAPAWAAVEPYGEPGGLQAEIVGGLGRFLDTLDHYWRRLRDPVPPAEWVREVQGLLDDFFLPQDDADEHTLTRFRQVMQDWQTQCEAAGFAEPLSSAIAAEHCLAALDQSGLSQRFFAGAVTFATLMPMRAIPFRRVCLLGMQDGAFPRMRVPASFDLMAAYPRPGDRSRREDDRYLFLEAVLSARDHLHISWVGRDIHDNSVLPPSVLVAQLRDHLDRGWAPAPPAPLGGVQPALFADTADTAAASPEPGARPTSTGDTLSAALTCHHPLQPFSPRYFSREKPGESGPRTLFTYAQEWQIDTGGSDPSAGGAAPLAAWGPEGPVDLKTLVRFLRHPMRAFFQQRLGVHFDWAQTEWMDEEPFSPNALEQWQLRRELLDGIGALDDPSDERAQAGQLDSILSRMQRRGTLVTGAWGEVEARRLRTALEAPLARYGQACREWPHRDTGALRMHAAVFAESEQDGRDAGEGVVEEMASLQFADVLDGFRRNEDGQWCRIVLSPGHLVGSDRRYRLKAMLPAWAEHVAAHAHGRALHTLLISPKGNVVFPPLVPEEALAVWRRLWAGWRAGMRAALPVEVDCATLWLRMGGRRELAEADRRKLSDCYAARMAGDLYLRRHSMDFEQLCGDGRFFDWAQDLYGDLSRTIEAYPGDPAGGRA